MTLSAQQLDRRLEALRSAIGKDRPERGWIRAIREALGMTTAQLGRRMGVKQPRIVELETQETGGNVTLKSLERAAEAMGCRFVYVLVPHEPLCDTLRQRASLLADQHLAAVEQTMRLEGQAVERGAQHAHLRETTIRELLKRPARLWDEQ